MSRAASRESHAAPPLSFSTKRSKDPTASSTMAPMQRKVSLADRITCMLAKAHARHVYARFVRDARRGVAVQRRVLLEKIRRNANTAFGKSFGFADIRSPDEFRRRVPVLTYEDHQPYIERVKNGEIDAMFGAGTRVHMFALTSGTTDQPKYIPVTNYFLEEYRRGWNAFGIKALLDHPQAILRKIVQVTSRMDESVTAGGIPCGAITGLMAATQKRLVRKYYVTPECIARIDDPVAKYYTIMRLAVPVDVAFSITASPATQLKLARTADTHREELIRDVHDGTLSRSFDVPNEVRTELAPRLAADPEAARRLDGLVERRGALLPRDYWNLGFLANWTGGTMGFYLQDYPRYFGDVPVRDIGLLASEGRISIPIEDATPAGILDVASHYFEFIPRDEKDAASPITLAAHELEVGQEYFVLLTTSSGLYRYDLGDLVRVTGYFGQAPVIEFLSKGAHTASLAGEKLTEHQVVQAMERACRRLQMPVPSFTLAARWGETPHYVLHVDDPSATRMSADLADALDGELRAINLEYAGKRQSHRLGAVQANPLPAGFMAAWDLRQAQSRRKGNEQYKHRYLLCRPGEDAEFLMTRPGTSTGDTGRRTAAPPIPAGAAAPDPAQT